VSSAPSTPAPDWGEQRDFYTFSPGTLARELPEFRIVREVGKGSMGLVYEAKVRETGQRIALKVLPPSLTLTERALARFYREGRLVARISHPDIVGFFDQGTRGRLHWFAMEFVDGITLEQRLEVGPVPVQKACEVIARVGRALQYAHEHGVVHRDIKPGNIMLRLDDSGAEQGVAITDFGLARETGTGSMTESGAIVGTPIYMAPEMVLGGSSSASTLADVYSLGATLYALVTGQPPYEGPTGQSVLKAVLEESPTPATRLRRDLPMGVAAIVHKAMERDPGRRYGSALEFAEDIERHLHGDRVVARLPNVATRAWRLALRRPLSTILVVMVIVLSVGGAQLIAERNRSALAQRLSEAERHLAVAATARDDHDRPLTAVARRDLLLSAVASASTVIEHDDTMGLAWLVRAKAHIRLEQYDEAIYDLDMAERLRGAATPEILQLRIGALQRQGDRSSTRRLQRDLTSLLLIAPDMRTRGLVAEHLLDLAAQATGHERREALMRANEVLDKAGEDDTRVAVSRARSLELQGDADAALTMIRAARSKYEGDLYVHLQAAAMFDRLGLYDEGAREHEMARLLRPGGEDPPKATPVNVDGLGKFLGDVDRLMQALDPPTGRDDD